MDGDGALLGLCHHLRLLLQTTDDTIDSIEEVLFLHGLAVMAGCNQCSLVADIGDIGTRETWSLTGQEVDIYAIVGLHGLKMYLEDLLALVEVGEIDVNLTIETSGAQQGRVEHVGPVGGSQDDHARVCAEAIHLCQQGVQRVLALVVATHGRILRAGTTHSVDLIDEDDAG